MDDHDRVSMTRMTLCKIIAMNCKFQFKLSRLSRRVSLPIDLAPAQHRSAATHNRTMDHGHEKASWGTASTLMPTSLQQGHTVVRRFRAAYWTIGACSAQMVRAECGRDGHARLGTRPTQRWWSLGSCPNMPAHKRLFRSNNFRATKLCEL